MMSTRRPATLNFTAPLVLDSPRHSGLSSIALVPGRHLIGTAADCGIQLHADGILERHALILVGENRTVVKSLDPRTWVNDGPVTEMALRAGDRLSIGPVTFRVRSATRDEAAAFVEAIPNTTETSPVVAPIPAVPVAVGKSMATPTVVSATAPAVLPSGPAPSLDSGVDARLEEIEQRLAELRQSTQAIVPQVDVRSSQIGTFDATASLLIQQQRDDLERRTQQTADEAQRIKQREELVTEREVQVERRQHSLIAEAERIAKVAETTRAALAAEHAQQVAIWNEWHATYQRTATELAAQLQAVEQHRQTLQMEADTLNATRSELDASHVAFESERQLFAADRLKLSNDLAEVATLRTQQESLRRQQQLQTEERDLQFSSRQREIDRLRTELSSDRQQLELERQSLVNRSTASQAESHAEALRLAALRVQLDLDQQRLRAELAELSSLRDSLQLQQVAFENERLEFNAFRATFANSRPFVAEVQINSPQPQAELPLQTSPFNEAQNLRPVESQLLSIMGVPPLNVHPVVASLEDVSVGADPPHDDDTFAEGKVEPPELLAELPSDCETSSVVEARNSPVEFTVSPFDVASGPVPPPLPTFTDPAGDFGVAVDWSALAAVDPQFGSSAPVVAPVNFGECELRPFDHDVTPPDSSQFPSPKFTGMDEPPWPEVDRSPGGNSRAAGPADPWGVIESSLTSTPTQSPILSSQLSEATQSANDPWSSLGTTAASLSQSAADTQRNFGTVPTENEDYRQPAIGFESNLMAEVSADFGVPVWPQTTLDSINFATQNSFAHETDSVQNARTTLEEVNRQFGIPSGEVPPEPATGSSLPAWWMEGSQTSAPADPAGDHGQPSWVDALRSATAEPAIELPPAMSDAEPVSDLRSQLAMLFDLPAASAESSHADSDREAPAAPIEPAFVQPAEATRETQNQDSTPPETDSHNEDSVDQFMARLLARSRTGSDEMGRTSPPPARQAVVDAASAIPATTHDEGMSFSLPDSDRSHLMAEPKHKQDKQAVRENLQSFRQVAHLSARSALARHSLQQLRNATIAKGVLLGVTIASAGWFFIEPLRGLPLQTWKGVACTLGAILSAMEFSRSWSQLNKPLSGKATKAASSATLEATTDEAMETEPRVAVDGDAIAATTNEALLVGEK